MYYEFKDTNVRILGALHVFPKDSPTMPAWVEDAYRWSQSIVFEHDPHSLLPHFKAINGSQLHTKISSASFSALNEFWPTEGPLAPLNELRPWGAVLALFGLLQQAVVGVEMQLLQRIAEDGKALFYLEHAPPLAALFDTIPLDAVQDGLDRMLADRSEPLRMFVKMHKAWSARDTGALLSGARESPVFMNPRIREPMFTLRNRAWVPQLRALMNTGTRTLICVGALHLIGSDNVVELLGHEVVAV